MVVVIKVVQVQQVLLIKVMQAVLDSNKDIQVVMAVVAEEQEVLAVITTAVVVQVALE